jgi:hypothetical protein
MLDPRLRSFAGWQMPGRLTNKGAFIGPLIPPKSYRKAQYLHNEAV